MRASRLLSILMTLQARGRATAPELAEACGVSLRTIYRDMDTLSGLDIPIYAEQGAGGGYRLLDGYRTRLNGLSEREAEALFLAGLAGPARDMGLEGEVSAARLKLLSALPQASRSGAERLQACFLLDSPAWFAEGEQPACLPAIVDAAWESRPLQIRYRSWQGEGSRRVEPLGVVLKGGAWYLVARHGGEARTYKVSRIQELEVLAGRFQRPAGFDLGEHWRASTARLEAQLHPNRARIRLTDKGLKMLQHFSSAHVRQGLVLEEPDESGWRQASLPVGDFRFAWVELLRLGPELEVLGPPQLRRQLADKVAAMAALYG
ncbi:YafY family protein [Gallaecimonas sp. GXIMD4217]|uniref:helix-turn-helix transcriptional regulator n=1 Tax=Gallaecimonas sp. GXIMD4217 TaxID=3131927 RepID=UPI00311AE6AB